MTATEWLLLIFGTLVGNGVVAYVFWRMGFEFAMKMATEVLKGKP
jgi:hypothetical protein